MFAIKISGLSKTYKNGYKALKKIDLQIKKGQFLALVGRNGAGKTTLIEILSSLIKKSTGSVIINSNNIETNNQLIKSKIGIVPQEVNLSIFETVLQVLVTQAGYFGINKDVAIQRAEQYLKELDLWEKRNQSITTLSGGMKKRVMIARALMHEPNIIFFDEPTAGVDAEARQKIWKIMKDLNNQGKTIILTTHYFNEVEKLCDSLAIISEGRIIINDSLKKIINNHKKQSYLIELEHGSHITIKDKAILRLSNCLFEISLDIETNLSKIILKIINCGGNILSIEPKNNRLEELFLSLS